MFIEQFRRIWWKRLWRDVEARRSFWRNDQLGRPVGNGRISFNRRKHSHGRKRLGRPALDGRCYRLGWIDGKGNGGNDCHAIGRRERLRRDVGVWWAHWKRWRCDWRYHRHHKRSSRTQFRLRQDNIPQRRKQKYYQCDRIWSGEPRVLYPPP